MNTSEKNYHFK